MSTFITHRPGGRSGGPFARVDTPFRLRARTVLPILALVGLTISVAVMSAGRWSLDAAREKLSYATRAIDTQHAKIEMAQAQAGLDDESGKLLGELQRQGLGQAGWGQRTFDIRQEPMKRHDLNALLTELEPGRQRLFAPESFEISVQRPDDAIFTAPTTTDNMLSVSLRGRLIFKTGVAAANTAFAATPSSKPASGQ